MSKDIKISIILDEEKKNQLETLMAQAGIRTKKELFENAMTLMKWVINQKQAGSIVGAMDEKGDFFKEFCMPAIDVQKKKTLEK